MTERSAGQWNAYVEAGKTREEQGARYREVPAALQAVVASHMRTVLAVSQKRRR